LLGILPLWLADSGGCGAWPTKSVRNAAGSRYSVEQLGASCRGITARIDTGDQWGGGATQPPGSSLPPLTRLARSPGKLRIHASQVHSRLSRFINDRRYFPGSNANPVSLCCRGERLCLWLRTWLYDEAGLEQGSEDCDVSVRMPLTPPSHSSSDVVMHASFSRSGPLQPAHSGQSHHGIKPCNWATPNICSCRVGASQARSLSRASRPQSCLFPHMR